MCITRVYAVGGRRADSRRNDKLGLQQGSAARAFMQTGDDEFESAGGIAGRWLNVAPGASLDSHQVPSRRGGAAANMSACGGGSGGGAVARGVAAVVGMSASGVGDGAQALRKIETHRSRGSTSTPGRAL